MGRLQDNTYATCLTDADVKKPKEDFFAGKNRNCRYYHFTMSGGKIDAALKRPGRRGRKHGDDHHRHLSPRHTKRLMAMDVSGRLRAGRGMKMRSHSESHRVGACKGDSVNAPTGRSSQ